MKITNLADIILKDDLTDIIFRVELSVKDYQRMGFHIEDHPQDAWTVWVVKFSDNNKVIFEICNEGLRVAADLTKEEKEMIINEIVSKGYDQRAGYDIKECLKKKFGSREVL